MLSVGRGGRYRCDTFIGRSIATSGLDRATDRIMADMVCSTLMYIDAEAKMDSFTDKDGNARTALNLLQRKSPTQGVGAVCLTISQATLKPSQDRALRAAARSAVPRARLMPLTSLSAALVPLKQHVSGDGRKRIVRYLHSVKDWTSNRAGNSLRAQEGAGSV